MAQSMILLGVSRNLKLWGLLWGHRPLGGCPQKGYQDPAPFLFLLPSHSGHKVKDFGPYSSTVVYYLTRGLKSSILD